MPLTSIRVDIADGVALVTLNAPKRRNALPLAMVDDIGATFDRFEADPAVRACVLTGAGPAFCAGADLEFLLTGDHAIFRRIYEAFLRVRHCHFPTVAAVNGAATGAGLNLVLACDLAITVPKARLVSRFLEAGLLPGGGHSWMLGESMGAAWTKAMVLFGEELDGETAVTAGLALRCVAPDKLMDEALRLARKAAAVPRPLLERAKQTIEVMPATGDHAQAVEIEAEAQVWSLTLPYQRERLDALRQQIAARAGKRR